MSISEVLSPVPECQYLRDTMSGPSGHPPAGSAHRPFPSALHGHDVQPCPSHSVTRRTARAAPRPAPRHTRPPSAPQRPGVTSGATRSSFSLNHGTLPLHRQGAQVTQFTRRRRSFSTLPPSHLSRSTTPTRSSTPLAFSLPACTPTPAACNSTHATTQLSNATTQTQATQATQAKQQA